MPARRIFLGLLAVTVGVAIFLDRVGGIDEVLPILRRWWPLALVAVGLVNLVRFAPHPWGVLGPLLVILAGGLLLFVTLGRVQREDYPLIWPAALVLAGFVVALAGADWPDQHLPHQNEFRQFVWLRGQRVISRAPQFWRADVTVLLGSFELDLREAELYRQAVVNVNAIFGSVDVIVPPGITVQTRRPFLLDRFGVQAGAPPVDGSLLIVNLLGFFGTARAWHAATQPAHDATSEPT